MAVKVKLTGWAETQKLLKDLPDKVQRQVIKQAMSKGAKMLADRARATTAFKDRTGRLRKSIEVQRRKAESTRLGDDVAATAKYTLLVERGWQRKTAKGSVHHTGTKFLTNALRESEKEILDHIESELKRFIERRLAKAAKK